MDKRDVVIALIARYDIGFGLATRTVDALFSEQGGTFDFWPKDMEHLQKTLDEWEALGVDLSS